MGLPIDDRLPELPIPALIDVEKALFARSDRRWGVRSHANWSSEMDDEERDQEVGGGARVQDARYPTCS